MGTAQLCSVFGKDSVQGLLPLPKISRYFESEYTICLTYENLEGQTDISPRRTDEVMKALGEMFDVAGSKVEASGQCGCLAECFKKELEKTLVEAKKEIDLVKKEEQLTGIFYNHQIKACDMSGSLDGGAIISPRNIDDVRPFADLTEALRQSTEQTTGKVYTFCCFDFDSDQLNANMGITRFSDGSEIKLNTLAKELEADIKDKREDFMVIGYADERGRDLYNLELGWYRAKRVVDSLCGVKSRYGNKLGICDGKGYDSPRIIIASCGENEPATGKSEEERRRDQIFYPAATGVGRLSCIPRIKSE
jgi:outer membrane protein OmpA-like peptidoglycan-associated protein